MTEYTVQQGDCLSSIAKQFNLLPDTIWNYGENAQLKQLRKSPNILYPGDILKIPDITPKTVDRASDARYKFKLKGATCKLRVRFRILDSTGRETKLSNESFRLYLGGQSIQGSTDGNGAVRQPLDAALESATIVIKGRSIPLAFGNLDPFDTISGVQARLNQAGYNSGPVDGILGPK